MRIIGAKDLSHVKICALWLSAEDYPVLLGKNQSIGKKYSNLLYDTVIMVCVQ